MLLKQQEEELRHLRAELEASKKSLAEEGSQRTAAERRAEQARSATTTSSTSTTITTLTSASAAPSRRSCS